MRYEKILIKILKQKQKGKTLSICTRQLTNDKTNQILKYTIEIITDDNIVIDEEEI